MGATYPTTLEIQALHHSIPNRYFQAGNSQLAVVFAGFGYTYDMPILYYLCKALLEKAYDVLAIDFKYSENKEFLTLEEPEQDKWFYEDVIHIGTFLTNLDYSQFLLAGKSLGSTACLKLLEQPTIDQSTNQIVWITPGTFSDQINTYIQQSNKNNFVIYGTKDPFTTEAHIQSIQDKAKIIKVQDGDHSLETPSIVDSISAIQTLIKTLTEVID